MVRKTPRKRNASGSASGSNTSGTPSKKTNPAKAKNVKEKAFVKETADIAGQLAEAFGKGKLLSSSSNSFLENLDSAEFPRFFWNVIRKYFSCGSYEDKKNSICFLIACFRRLECEWIRSECFKLCSLYAWGNLLPARREIELQKRGLEKYFRHYEKKLAKSSDDAEEEEMLLLQRDALSRIVCDFLGCLSSDDTDDLDDSEFSSKLGFCCRVMELFIDLETQIPTRKYFDVLLDDHLVLSRARLSLFLNQPKCEHLQRLLVALRFYKGFQVDPVSWDPISDQETETNQSSLVYSFQRFIFNLMNDKGLKNSGSQGGDDQSGFPFSRISFCQNRSNLQTFLLGLLDDDNNSDGLDKESSSNFDKICLFLKVRRQFPDSSENIPKAILIDHIVSSLEYRRPQTDAISEASLYPTENDLFDPLMLRNSGDLTEEYETATNFRLGLQYLSLQDYLLRNFSLYQLESCYQVRLDLEDSIIRMRPTCNHKGFTDFTGWSRMATRILQSSINHVGEPAIGEKRPTIVTGQIRISLARYKDSIKKEWDELRTFDSIYLIHVKAHDLTNTTYKMGSDFRSHFGVQGVRGAEIIGIYRDDSEPDVRILKVSFDPNQYQKDVLESAVGSIYGNFNVILRRKAKENNGKQVLATMKELLMQDIFIPDWFKNIILGYESAHSFGDIEEIDFRDTFVSEKHLKEIFGKKLTISSKGEQYSLSFKDNDKIIAKGYGNHYTNYGQKRNEIPFTKTQVDAIKNGISRGISLVVGPPGTGKTDVAVQIISNLYHNYPGERILVITHSNHALNQIFEKISKLDIEERHLLRLGHGGEDLQLDSSFGQMGRVAWFFERRSYLLSLVDKMAKSLKVTGDYGYTCETAANFRILYFLPKLLEYKECSSDFLENFPFKSFFEDWEEESSGAINAKDFCDGRFEYLNRIFEELEDIRPFEILKTSVDQSNFLLMKEAKIIAMTCTYASLRRQNLASIGFNYDTVVIEEAGQILEIETFIPFVLQGKEYANELKRVVLVGDHLQLPPIVQHQGLQNHANLDQSMFSRFIRLGCPTTILDAQGRCRDSLAQLFRWRYPHLENLPHVEGEAKFGLANPGFLYDYQFINVEDYEGKGEIEPVPHYFQNVGEAEYAVALYQYMRLLGYPAEKICIITSYNGQKDLIQEILHQRCSWNASFGRPRKVATIDRFQGEQSDYVILSLVRTKNVGHLRDLRRLTVAMSRACLGLYVVGRFSLFQGVKSLEPVFGQFASRNHLELSLLPDESYGSAERPCERPLDDNKDYSDLVIKIKNVEDFGKYVYTKMQG